MMNLVLALGLEGVTVNFWCLNNSQDTLRMFLLSFFILSIKINSILGQIYYFTIWSGLEYQFLFKYHVSLENRRKI